MDFAPWAASPFSYAGWVPNVGSHLSFSLIGAGRNPGVAHYTQTYDGRNCRMACVFQRRETDDFLSWRWLTRLFAPDVVQHWLLIGSTRPVTSHVCIVADACGDKTIQTATDEQGAMVGSIYMMPHQSPKRQLSQKWMLHEARALIAPRYIRTDKQLDDMCEELGRHVRWRNPGFIRVEFALMRTGELRLWYDEETLALDIRSERLVTTARQAYFFVKDMVHHHTHHEPSSDQITPLTPVGTQTAARRQSGEENWRRETVWSLSRAVEILLRAGKLIDLRQAMGILAYADAFQKTLLPYLRNADNSSAFVPNSSVYAYDYSHMKDSTRILIEQAQARRTHISSMLIAALASSIAALSLLSSLVSTHNSSIDSTAKGTPRLGLISLKIPEGALAWLAHSPISVVTIIWAAVFLIGMIMLDGGVRLLRHGPRKIWQATRGVSLSVGRRLRLRARGTHYLLIVFYVVVIVTLTVLMVRLPFFIHEFVNGKLGLTD